MLLAFSSFRVRSIIELLRNLGTGDEKITSFDFGPIADFLAEAVGPNSAVAMSVGLIDMSLDKNTYRDAWAKIFAFVFKLHQPATSEDDAPLVAGEGAGEAVVVAAGDAAGEAVVPPADEAVVAAAGEAAAVPKPKWCAKLLAHQLEDEWIDCSFVRYFHWVIVWLIGFLSLSQNLHVWFQPRLISKFEFLKL